MFCSLTRLRTYLPEEVAFLKCSVEKGTCCSEGLQVCNKNMHVFAREAGGYLSEGGNFELFWWKKRHVVHRGANYVLLVSKNMHVFARGGGNFELFWWTKKRVFQRWSQVCFVR